MYTETQIGEKWKTLKPASVNSLLPTNPLLYVWLEFTLSICIHTCSKLGRAGKPFKVVSPRFIILNDSKLVYSSVSPSIVAALQLSRISSVT